MYQRGSIRCSVASSEEEGCIVRFSVSALTTSRSTLYPLMVLLGRLNLYFFACEIELQESIEVKRVATTQDMELQRASFFESVY